MLELIVLWCSIDWRLRLAYLSGGLAALLPGSYLVAHLNPNIYFCGLGALIVTYSAVMLWRPAAWIASDGPLSRIFVGALGGITGPLAAFPAASVGIWCGLRGFDKFKMRSIIQPYILVMQVATLACLALIGASPVRIGPGSLAYLFPGIVGARIGTYLFRHVSDARYQRLVVLGLMASGIALLLK